MGPTSKKKKIKEYQNGWEARERGGEGEIFLKFSLLISFSDS